MDIGQVIQGSKGEILAELARRPQSPKDLASRMKTSISHIVQQLAILEAHGLVDKKKEPAKGPGKPKTRYALKQDFMHATIYKNRSYAKKHIPLTHADIFTSLNHHASFLDRDDSYYFLKFIYGHEDLIRSCESIAIIKPIGSQAGQASSAIELLIITENLDPFRRQFANNVIRRPGGEKVGGEKGGGERAGWEKAGEKGERKIIIWSHNRYEIEDGLQRKDNYFTSYIGRIESLYDSTGIFNLLMK